jgi:hypothetical protein
VETRRRRAVTARTAEGMRAMRKKLRGRTDGGKREKPYGAWC